MYRYMRLQFRAAQADNIFWRKIADSFRELQNVFGIAYDILVVACDDNDVDHDLALHQVLQFHGKENLKIHKQKCYFRYSRIPFFGEINFQEWYETIPLKIA